MFSINIEIEIFVTKKILFCCVMSYRPAIKKSFKSGTYFLEKKLIPKTLQKTLIVYKKCTNWNFTTKLSGCTFYT